MGRPLAVAVLLAVVLVAFTLHAGQKPKEYKLGWNYVFQAVKSGSSLNQAGTPLIDCSSAADSVFRTTFSYGMQSPSSYQKYSDWNQGCGDAMKWIQSNGLNGLQAPIF